MAETSNNQQRLMAFYGEQRFTAETERQTALRRIRYLRALRAWVREGCYAWFRLSDDIESAQQRLLPLRKAQHG